MTYAFSCLWYPPILHFIPWTWSRQPGELSKHLFPYNLQCIHCFMWIRWLKNQQPGLSLRFHCQFFSTSLLTREKNPDCRLPPASTYWEPCVSIYCTWLLCGLPYLKNKQVDISTTFYFSETISWLTLVTILIMMKLLLCQTARMLLLPFLSERLIRLPIMRRPLPSLTIPCSQWSGRGLPKNRERDKRELDWSKKPNCWSLWIRSKNCFQRLVVPFLWSK